MNLCREHWNEEDYEKYIGYLKSLQDENYRKFHQSLTTTRYEILGLRVPMQRKIAKEISKGNIEEFLSFCKDRYYEEVNIEGFVLAGIKNLSLLEKYFNSFLLKIDNWAICDGFCNSLKIVQKNKEYFWKKIQELLSKEETFSIRVGLILLLCFYVEKEYIFDILQLVKTVTHEEYYVGMGLAWLLAECYIKYPKETLELLKEKSLSSFVQNKTISKIRDSYRVSKEDKEFLKSLKM